MKKNQKKKKFRLFEYNEVIKVLKYMLYYYVNTFKAKFENQLYLHDFEY